MNHKVLLCFALASLLIGCSKKEDTSVPSPAPSTTADKSAMKAPALDNVATNAQAAISSAASNVTASANNIVASATNNPQIPSSAANALNALGGNVQPSSPVTAPVTPDATTTPTPAAVPSIANLSTDQLTQGLKEALAKGLKHAVTSLGQPGGFLTNMNVKIPLPDKLQSVEKTLRAIGQGQLADQCITTMNQAAEQAVPVAADVFASSLQNMSVDDVKGILNGPPDAATQFFRRTTSAELTKKFQPIVQQSMTKCGATAAYGAVIDKAKSASPFFSNPSLDLNSYVTGKALDGLFKIVAEEEKRIRENPVARNTDLLKSVFGAFQK